MTQTKQPPANPGRFNGTRIAITGIGKAAPFPGCIGCETEHETDRGPLCPEKSALPWNTARRYGGSPKRVIIEDWRRDYYMLRRPTADSGAIS